MPSDATPRKITPKRILIFAGLALPVALAGYLYSARAGQSTDPDTFLRQSAEYFDQQTRDHLPQQVDKVTTLKSVQLSLDDRTLYYRYAISSVSSTQLDAAGKAKLEDGLRSRLVASTCQQQELLERFRRYRVRISHQYTGNDGKLLAKVDIDPQTLRCRG
ncbi:hypothetical protein D3C76_745480 [compost metagenome]|uniref:Uncharacterized protein n=1 Tax=Pseudomonas jinjuensis TaxID=198616 RepID=A0A1H0HXV5_9PSED|nr:hypothetical protein [Pseudomonas jinjuensis]SDO23997.1 hypothetical protein SAMN05216193_10958 [Pseudomonas jinjuensis]